MNTALPTLTSARTAETFTVTCRQALTNADLWDRKFTAVVDCTHSICESVFFKDALCTVDELIEALKNLFPGMWRSGYEPCNDYRQLTLEMPDGTWMEYTVTTAQGILWNEEVCAEAEAKEIRKNGYGW